MVQNDFDPCDNEITVTDLTYGPLNGNAEIESSTELTYVPDPGFSGIDTIDYLLCNDCGACDTGTVIITIDLPVDCNEIVVVCTQPVTPIEICFDFCGNDFSLVNGYTTFNCGLNFFEDETCLTYTPLPGITGTDSVFVVGCNEDQTVCDTLLAYVDIAESCSGITAVDDVATTSPSTPITIDVLANDEDPTGLGLSDPVIINQPSNGTVVLYGSDLVYIPDPGFTGIDMITYITCNFFDECDTAVVAIMVEEDCIAPELTIDDVDVVEGFSAFIEVLLNDNDPNGGSLLLVEVLNPQNGTAVVFGDGIAYVPDETMEAPFTDQVSYIVCTDCGACDTGLVNINILDNLPPSIIDPNSGLELGDTVFTSVPTDSVLVICIDAIDPEGEMVDISIIQNGDCGNAIIDADGCLVYEAGPDACSDTLVIVACDPQDNCDTLVIVIDVFDDNMPPVIAQGDTLIYDIPQDSTLTDCLTITDPDGDPINIEVIDGPDNGSASTQNDSCFTYIPDPGFTGTDTLVIVACDPQDNCDTIVIIINVEPGNSAPVALDDMVATDLNTSVIIDILANDNDPDMDSLTVSIIELPNNGIISFGMDGEIVYTPEFNFTGIDTFTYIICDPDDNCDTADVIVLVGLEDIEAIGDTAYTSIDVPVDIDVLTNDTGVNISVLTFTPPSNGTAVLNADGSFTYTPNPGFAGQDAFIYDICDAMGNCDQALVIILISPNQDCVVTIPDAFSPNNDGFNDFFVIQYEGECDFTLPSIQVFNRWGNIVYKSDSYWNDWNGNFRGNNQPVPVGTYFYIIDFGSELEGSPFSGSMEIKRN